MIRLIFMILSVLVSASSAGLFTLDSDVVLERQLNRMWAVFGTAETGVVPSQGNEAGWAEWNALKFAWSTETEDLEKLEKLLLTYPMSEGGYVWSWKTEEGWPTHHHRHFDTNSKYILGVWRYAMWQGGPAFLESTDPETFPNQYEPEVADVSKGMTVIEKCRLAMQYQLDELKGRSGLMIIPSEASDGTVDGKPTDYWDNFLFGHKSAYANIYFYASLNAMRELELLLGNDSSAGKYEQLMPKVKQAFNETFWDEEMGRYIGCMDVDGRKWDLGFTYLNLEAITYDLADQKRAGKIFQWLDGERVIESDLQTVNGIETGVTGKDIYDLKWAPRATTKAVEAVPVDGKCWWWDLEDQITVDGPRPSAAYGEHVENGGAIFYVSFYDLMARLDMLGADNSFERFSVIMEEFAKDELQRDPENNVGATWKWGLIDEFPESGLIPTFLIHGYLGLKPMADGVALSPNLPAELPRVKLNEASWRGHRFSISVDHEKIVFQSLDKSGTPIRVSVRDARTGSSFEFQLPAGETVTKELIEK